MAAIPEDVVVEILKRLPVKSLLRLKATSKGWCGIIKSRRFTKLHRDFAPDRLLLGSNIPIPNHFYTEQPDTGMPCLRSDITLTYKNYYQFYCFPPEDEDEDDHDESPVAALPPNSNLNTDGLVPFERPEPIIVTCDGIVCIYGESRNIFNAASLPIPITLWNPSTRQVKSLPNSTRYVPPSWVLNQIWGPSWEVGIGYDCEADDYKVVAIVTFWDDPDLHDEEREPVVHYAEVYSLKTNSWRLVDGHVPFFRDIPPQWTYTSGFYHWHSLISDSEIFGEYAILSFDMSNEVFRTTSATPTSKLKNGEEEPPAWPVRFSSLNDSLVVIYYHHSSPTEVWVRRMMNGGDYCWILDYIIELPVAAIPPAVYASMPPDYDLWMVPIELWNKRSLVFKFVQCKSGSDYTDDDIDFDFPDYDPDGEPPDYYVPEEEEEEKKKEKEEDDEPAGVEEFYLYDLEEGSKGIRKIEYPSTLFDGFIYKYKQTLVSLATNN